MEEEKRDVEFEFKLRPPVLVPIAIAILWIGTSISLLYLILDGRDFESTLYRFRGPINEAVATVGGPLLAAGMLWKGLHSCFFVIKSMRRRGTVRLMRWHAELPGLRSPWGYVRVAFADVRRIKIEVPNVGPKKVLVWTDSHVSTVESTDFRSSSEFTDFVNKLKEKAPRADLLQPTAEKFKHWSE